MSVIENLAAVAADISAVGIGKGQRNDYDKYQYRGIDDIYNVIGPILAKHGVVIIPSVVSHTVEVKSTSQGKATNHAVVVVNYTCYHNESSIIGTAVGEAMDRGDKALNKAMTSAYKNFIFEALCIPVEGQDSEAETHQIVDAINADQLQAYTQLRGNLTAEAGAKWDAWMTNKGVGKPEEIPPAHYQSIMAQLEKLVAKDYEESESNGQG